MKKNNWNFTQFQLVILSIMASIIIFIFVIDIYLLFQNDGSSSSPNEIKSTSPIHKTPSELSTTTFQTNQPESTNQLTTAHPQTTTPTRDSIYPTPSSNPLVTSVPTTPPPPKFLTDEWDDNTKNWEWFSTSGDDNLLDIYNEGGVLVFSLLDQDTNAYFIYKPWEYDNVRITTQFEVRSNTKISTIIVCNYTDQFGWYEFDIGTNGLWEVRMHDTQGKTGYLSLISGGSLAIQTGLGINEYTATCKGNHLNLSINGTEVLDFTDDLMKFERGKVGLGVISYSQVPVLVESTWIKINQP